MTTSAHDPFIFVVIPFDQEFDEIYANLETIARLAGATAKRADTGQRQSRQISDEIVRLIRTADLVVADISQPNPNVYYEIGYAHALGKPVLLIARDMETVGFDVRNYQVITYGNNTHIRAFSQIVSRPLDSALEDSLQSAPLRQPILDALNYIDSIGHSHRDLFSKIVGMYLADIRERAHQWSTGRFWVDQEGAIKKGVEVFQNLKRGGFVTFLIKINEFWSSTDTYAQECRIAAQRDGINIQRVFISPDVESLHHHALRERIELDEQCGIQTFIALSRCLEPDSIHDFGIWDDEVLCLIETNPVRQHEVNGATFSRLPGELSSARDWKTKITAKSFPAPAFLRGLSTLRDQHSHLSMLLRSADFMHDQAQGLCRGSYLGKEDCKWYHQAWQYLRAADMVSAPDRHGDFYFNALQRALNPENALDVLVSGTADYGIVQQLYASVPDHKLRHLKMFVLDLCRTPLSMCEWYTRHANRQGPRLIPIEEDILSTNFSDDSLDVVVTDAFLTRFGDAEKRKVVSEWSRILRPGGVVITTARIANGTRPSPDGLITSTPRDVEEFANRAVQAAETIGEYFPIALSELHSLAKGYAERIASVPFLSDRALRDLFETNGFMVQELTAQPVKGEFHPTTVYGRICAVKKGPGA